MYRGMSKKVPTGERFTGTVLVIVEESSPGVFGALAPQFKALGAFGSSRASVLRHLRNAILDQVDEGQKDPKYLKPKAVDFSAKEVESFKAEIFENSDKKSTISAAFLQF